MLGTRCLSKGTAGHGVCPSCPAAGEEQEEVMVSFSNDSFSAERFVLSLRAAAEGLPGWVVAALPVLLLSEGFQEHPPCRSQHSAPPAGESSSPRLRRAGAGPAPSRTGFSPISSPRATDTICQDQPGVSHSPPQPSAPPSPVSRRWLGLGFPALLGTRRTPRVSICPPVITWSLLPNFNQI